ncbi:hypothetical protein D3C73_686190 [compost metagenome]
MGDAGTRRIQANFLHGDIETAAVFGFVDGIGGSADHGYAKLGQYALTFQLQRTVQRGLPTHGWQHRIRALFLDDFTHHFPVDRLDVGGIGHFRVGHDGGRVRVDQYNAVTFFTQRLTRLGTRVVKFTRLADNDRASAEDQDAFYICTFWHGFSGS